MNPEKKLERLHADLATEFARKLEAHIQQVESRLSTIEVSIGTRVEQVAGTYFEQISRSVGTLTEKVTAYQKNTTGALQAALMEIRSKMGELKK